MTINDERQIETHAVLTWAVHAACVGQQELFFSDHKLTVVRKAKEICSTCAVRLKCLDHAMNNLEFGVWGGMTANERRRASRKMIRLRKKSVEE